MISASVMNLFIPTFLVVSLTPGMCMTLSLTLGMTIGVKKTLFMMAGELAGVALVAVTAVTGAAALMLHYPGLFLALKYGGGAFLVFLGLKMILKRQQFAPDTDRSDALVDITGTTLMLQGFVTAIANPKGWAFMISLLPPFIDPAHPVGPQLIGLLVIILAIEFTCLLLYANGGQTLSRFLGKTGNLSFLNRVAGLMMLGVGLWMALG